MMAATDHSMPLSDQPDDAILAIADPIMDNLMEASTVIDHARHVRDFTDRLKTLLPPDRFERICRHYQSEKGYFGPRTFVAAFRRPDSVVLIWTQTFTRQAGEYVAEMVLVHRHGRYLVDHVMVF